MMIQESIHSTFAFSVLDQLPDAITWARPVLDGTGAVVDFEIGYANKAADAGAHHPAGSLTGLRVLRDGLPSPELAPACFRQYLEVHQVAESREFCLLAAPSLREVIRQPLDGGVLSTNRGRQAQREASLQLQEQRSLLDNILKHSSNGISVGEMIRDADGRIIDMQTVMANEAAATLTGLPRNTVLSQTGSELDAHFPQSDFFQRCIRCMETGEPFIAQYFLASSGKWLEVSVSKMDETHQIYIFTDVTSIKKAQLDQQKLVEDLQRSNASLEEFAYVASHDLQEPLRKIRFFSERLKAGLDLPPGHDSHRMLERMEVATIRMKTLIDDLLAFSQVSSKPTAHSPVDLGDVVHQVLQDLEAAISETGAVLHVDPLPRIAGDERQLRQLFQNLIGNALKYRKPGVPPEVTVSCRAAGRNDPGAPATGGTADGPWHRIQVTDNGIGFDPEDAENIFKVFHRLHGRSEYEGTGVGLAIVQKVVQNHGGHISAIGEPGKGATFRLLLPATA
ncbi:ATP-binding protein [Paraflavisolibacter sp. H34]|uniref:sensor histidine kinase n=1 Tax=Huijunlia imazamoxiresistens TaxID=3127457 RepID=UPI00301A2C73